MTDINTELEAIAAEELGDEQLTEVAADEPKKGAAAAMPPEKVEGERQDMGPAVVSPDAKSDPGKEASKKAKKSPDLPDKGKPSDASPSAMGDGSGPMKSGAREEVEHDEDAEVEAIAEEEDTQDEIVSETHDDTVPLGHKDNYDNVEKRSEQREQGDLGPYWFQQKVYL